MKKKCIVLFSGGLDSRLAVKIMQERGFEVLALNFKLPFSKHNEKELKEFSKKEKIKLKIFDCTKGKLLKKYLKVIKKAEHGVGAGVNPCVDCRIFILKKAKKFGNKKGINLIVTGEVFGERPMSQIKKAMEIVEKKSELGKRLLRPLSDYDIHGRKRNKQIALAKKFRIKYPHPAGGCLLCEKELKKRFGVLIKNNLINEKNLPLVNIGRHFFIKNCWFVVGRNFEENKMIEKFRNCIKSTKGKPAVYFSGKNCKKFAKELQEDYKTKGIKKYSKWRL